MVVHHTSLFFRIDPVAVKTHFILVNPGHAIVSPLVCHSVHMLYYKYFLAVTTALHAVHTSAWEPHLNIFAVNVPACRFKVLLVLYKHRLCLRSSYFSPLYPAVAGVFFLFPLTKLTSHLFSAEQLTKAPLTASAHKRVQRRRRVRWSRRQQQQQRRRRRRRWKQ